MVEPPILVTGASGFIGQHLVAALHAERKSVRALTRRRKAAAALADLGADPIVGDLLDSATIERAADGVGGVFHLAGKLFTPGSRAEEYQRLHVDGSVRLFEACVAAGRLEFFVLCSTTGVHGPTGAAPAREDDSGAPQNAYEVTKARAEQAAIAVAARTQAPLVIARPGLVYGPGDRHLLGWFRAISAGYYRVLGRGDNHLHPIYVDDLVRALLLCAPKASPVGRAYHLVGREAMTVRELSDAIGAAVGRPVPRLRVPIPIALGVGAAMEGLPIPRRALPLTRSRVRFLTQNRAYDGSRAREELGFVATVPLADGLARTVAWYRGEGLLP